MTDLCMLIMVCLLLSRSVIAQPLAMRDAFTTELM